jgi:hypothetical protein
MIETTAGTPIFNAGDHVVLVRGGYLGTPGVFLHLRKDPKWADIAENDGSVRAHPVEWLGQSAGSTERNRTV